MYLVSTLFCSLLRQLYIKRIKAAIYKTASLFFKDTETSEHAYMLKTIITVSIWLNTPMTLPAATQPVTH